MVRRNGQARPAAHFGSHGTGPKRVGWFDAGYRTGSYEICESVIRKEHALPRIPDE